MRTALSRASCLLLLAAPLFAQEPQQTPRFGETLTVERIVVDVRVVDGAGRPILGLQPGDFDVEVGGKRVAVESALWVGAGEPEADPNADVVVVPEPPREPRLVVFLIQKDLERSRITGLLRMVDKAERLLAALRPDDRAAVLLFDTQLLPLQDFSADHVRVRRALREGFLHPRRAVQHSEEPSLLAHIGSAAARRAASPETALRLVGEALEQLPGNKTLVFLGWGLGRMTGASVALEPDYEPARRALLAARTSVFSLDVTDADYHTLEVGLRQVAEDTGGFYEKTHLFPDQALERVERALAGFYVLAFERPAASRSGSLEISLRGRKGTVLAPAEVG